MHYLPNDVLVLTLTCTVICFVAIFETTSIAVEIFEGLHYFVHCIITVFITFNIVGNLIACWYVDTSIKSVSFMPPQVPTYFSTWRFCEKCNIMAPPRSWHCKSCNVCILKRDHHCFFTARCVGHRNYRYFLFFTVYTLIGTLYASVLNSYYCFWLYSEIYNDMAKLICFLMPTLIILHLDFSGSDWHYLIIFVFLVVLTGVLISGMVLCCHFGNILIGATAHERTGTQYNLGSKRRNMEMVLGKNLCLVWLAPFVRSKLPHDGIHWHSLLEGIEVKKM